MSPVLEFPCLSIHDRDQGARWKGNIQEAKWSFVEIQWFVLLVFPSHKSCLYSFPGKAVRLYCEPCLLRGCKTFKFHASQLLASQVIQSRNSCKLSQFHASSCQSANVKEQVQCGSEVRVVCTGMCRLKVWCAVPLRRCAVQQLCNLWSCHQVYQEICKHVCWVWFTGIRRFVMMQVTLLLVRRCKCSNAWEASPQETMSACGHRASLVIDKWIISL